MDELWNLFTRRDTMQEYYKNGQIKQVTKEGTRTHYFENGKIKAIGSFDGKMQGDWKFYRKSGELWQVGCLEHDLKNGEWIRYYQDGQVEKEVQFVRGKEKK
mgnify:CR=1 FL=1